MKIYPIHDPLIKLTSEELDEILLSRQRGKMGGNPDMIPGTAWGDSARLWYVTEFVIRANAHKRSAPEVSNSWKERAFTIAAEVAHKAAGNGNPQLLLEVVNALKGRRKEPTKHEEKRRVKFHRVHRLAHEFHRIHKHFPIQKELIDFSIERGERVNVADASAVYNMPGCALPSGTPGPKPKR